MSEKDKPAGAGFFGTKKLLKKYKKDTPGESVEEVYKNSGLGKWFGQSAGGEAGWDRYNTKGERVGKCGDSKPGEGKPKCLSPKKARQLRAQGGKKAIGNAAKRKKAQDPDTDRPGTGNKPINVSNNIKKEDRDMKSAKEFLNDMINEQINEDLLNEKNKPTNPALWAKSISAAKSKFDVYPSAYANAWASKHYKAAGGGWESTNEETELDEALKVRKNDGPFTVVALKGGKVVDTFRGAEHGELKDVVAFSRANNKGAKISVEAKGGKVVHTEGFDLDDELIDLDLSEAKKKRITKLHGKFPKGTHYCATHVEHAEFGHGNPIHSQHAAPDEFGDIEWYDVMFEHGIEQGVATDDLQIHLGEVHENHDHTEGEDLEEGEFDSRKSAEEIRLRTKYRMSKDGGKDGKPYSPADMHGAMDSLQRKKARTSGVRRLGSQHPSNKKLNLTVGEAMGPGIAHKDGLKDAQKTDSMKRYYAQVKKDQAARAKQIEQERKDGIRSKYESVEQVDEVSSDTLRSYVHKRSGQVRSDLSTDKHSPKTNKKAKGVSAALSRLDARKNKLEPELKREDVEQVDELSSNTLRSYVAKAKQNTDHNKRGKRTDGIGDALSRLDARSRLKRKADTSPEERAISKRLASEDVEQVDEISSDTLRSYVAKRRKQTVKNLSRTDGGHSDSKLKRSNRGVRHALSRLDARDPKGYFYGDKALAREDTEQVDELRRDTLGSYADKARGDIEGIKNVLKSKKLGPVSDKHREELERELANRTKGRKRAIAKKYTREDAEQVDELKMPEKDKRGRAKDPVIGAALERGSRRADLKADGKLRRGDTDGAEGHMTRSRKRQAASRTPVEEAKVGDTVHLGHATKGGSGVKGKVVKIDGRNVHIKNDKGAMFKGPMDRVSTTEAYGSDEDRKRREQQDIAALHKKGDKAGIARIMAARAKEKMRSEAIKYDAAHPDQGITGRVTGKGKRDRGPKGSKTSGEVRTKYSGHPVYKDDSPGLPIKANDIGRLIKTARKKSTKPYDSRNLRNPRLTKDHVEHGVAEGMADSAKRAAKILAARTPKNVHNPGRPTKKSAGDNEAARREKARRDSLDRRTARDKEMLNNREGVEDMTAAQERDRKFRDNPTRGTVAGVRLPSTDAERARYVKKFQADKAGKPGNTKQRKKRDLKMRLRGPK